MATTAMSVIGTAVLLVIAVLAVYAAALGTGLAPSEIEAGFWYVLGY